MSTSYPRYRVSTWIDTSAESMALPCPRMLHGIQVIKAKGGRWQHCERDGKALLFREAGNAHNEMERLKAESMKVTA